MFSNFSMPECTIHLESLSCTISSVFDAQHSNILNSLCNWLHMLYHTGNTTESQNLQNKKSMLSAQTFMIFGSLLGKEKKKPYPKKPNNNKKPKPKTPEKRMEIWHKEQNVSRSAAIWHHRYLIYELTCLGVKLLLTQVMTNSYCESLNFYPEKQTRWNIDLHFSCQELYMQEELPL